MLFGLNLIWANIIFEPSFAPQEELRNGRPSPHQVQGGLFTPEEEPQNGKPEEELLNNIIILDVPFTPQAPLAEWSDPRQQDGCEEAAVLIAMKWVKGETIASGAQAKEEIIAMSSWQLKNYGEYRDTSAADTVERLIKEYYQYDGVQVKNDITIEDIIKELEAGNLVITPMNGQILDNPYYTPPGPERHMLVVRGYDYATKEFITNDPGTKRGELYRYNEKVLYNAIRDYKTGYHVAIDVVNKNMIVIKK